MVWCSVKIYRHMRQSIEIIPSDSSTHRLAAQLNTALVTQAIIPLVLENGPVIVIALFALVNLDISMREWSSAFNPILGWAPVFNALGIVLVVQPYRRAIWRALAVVQRHNATNKVAINVLYPSAVASSMGEPM